MKLTKWLGAAAICAGVALAGGHVYSQDKDPKAGEQPKMTPEQQAEMDAWMKAATPNEHHKALAARAGDWDGAGKMWMEPGAPPVDSKATLHRKVLLGGRFLEESYEGGEMMGMPFTGHGIFGFDNVAHKHNGVWMDTMGTMMMTMEGACEGEGCKKVTYNSTFKDPMGRTCGFKCVVTILGPDKEMFEGWNIMPEGTTPPGTPREMKAMEMTYTRKK